MDTTDQLSSIKPGDRNSIGLALGLFLLLIFNLIYVINKFLLPMKNFVTIDKNYIYGIYAFTSVMIICVVLFLSKLHKIGFRWFTQYSKVTRPDFSWLCIIEIITLFISQVTFFIMIQFYIEEYSNFLQNGFLNPSKENASKIMGYYTFSISIFLTILILEYYIILSVISKLILPISIKNAFKSSILNLLIFIVILGPIIIFYIWAGMKMQNQIENNEQTNTSKTIQSDDLKKDKIEVVKTTTLPEDKEFEVETKKNMTEIQQVSSVCNWKPPTPKEVLDINKPLPTAKELQQIIQDGTGQDKMIVSNKGRTHFYSLPNINCKSDLFIVRKDTVFWLDSYKDGNDEYSKVAYISESLKKIIIGWIPSQGLCQYEPAQSLEVRCGI